jgi:hypothetical protein
MGGTGKIRYSLRAGAITVVDIPPFLTVVLFQMIAHLGT